MPCLRAFARLPQGRRLQLWPVLCGSRVLYGGLVQERHFRRPRRNGPGLWRELPVLLLQQGLPFRHGEPGAVGGTGADRPSPPLPGARARPPRRRPQGWPRTPPTRHHPPLPPPASRTARRGFVGRAPSAPPPATAGLNPRRRTLLRTSTTTQSTTIPSLARDAAAASASPACWASPASRRATAPAGWRAAPAGGVR